MTDLSIIAAAPVQRRRIVVRGVVPGVGFRPFAARAAADLRLTGYCGNDEACAEYNFGRMHREAAAMVGQTVGV